MNHASAMRAVRVHAQNERLKRNVDKTINKLTSSPESPVRVTTAVARLVLLWHLTVISEGRTYSTQVKNIGAGVKEVYLKKIGGKNGG